MAQAKREGNGDQKTIAQRDKHSIREEKFSCTKTHTVYTAIFRKSQQVMK